MFSSRATKRFEQRIESPFGDVLETILIPNVRVCKVHAHCTDVMIDSFWNYTRALTSNVPEIKVARFDHVRVLLY